MGHILGRLSGIKLEVLKDLLLKDAEFHRSEGLYLEYIWKNDDKQDEVLFLFRTDDLQHSKELIGSLHKDALATDPKAILPLMTFLAE